MSEASIARNRRYYYRHLDRRRAANREAMRAHRARKRAQLALPSPEDLAAKRQASKERARIRHREHMRRYRLDPVKRMIESLRTRVKAAVRAQRTGKHSTTVELLGCTPAACFEYLLTKLQPGMTPDDLRSGRVHIDHIKPCASFDLTDPAQQRACFHYTNLQPLWAADNLRKSDKV